MKTTSSILIALCAVCMLSCKENSAVEVITYEYCNKQDADTLVTAELIAVTDEEFLQLGSRVAYLDIDGDTIIPFGKYAYMGTDTLVHFANVIEHANDGSYGRIIAIDRNQNVLYDIVLFDNGPDYFNEDLVRALRNGKMGFANKYGQIVIPCEYDFAGWFENGKAKVTYDATVTRDKHNERTSIESDEWFYIDKSGTEIKGP